MISMKLDELAEVLDCDVTASDVTIDRIVTDSRKVHYGSLFAALPGSQVHGHEFAESAEKLGAAALLVSKKLDLETPQLVVDDVLLALGKIARLVRDRVNPAVVAIIGSNGKTSVKEMMASILRQESEVLATQGNFNNELGLPLSLFELEQQHRYAVLEMGASKAGDIDYLCNIAQPDVGLITNVGPAHLQGFGDEKGVATAKGELYAALPPDGWAIINADEPWAEQWLETNTAGHVLTFGTQPHHDIHLGMRDGKPFLSTPNGEFEVALALPGKHNQVNAAAACAAALALDIPLDAIQRGLERMRPVPGRLNLIHSNQGWTVIDDTYNANPASLYSALQVLAGMQGTSWLVLGDMKELGNSSRKLHAEVGDAARLLGVSRVFATGEMTGFTVDAFGAGASHYSDMKALIRALRKELREGINCLVKGSRSMGMEAVVSAISPDQGMREAS
jgi:UDP-N-acetylmuramoyl-tripeptide--D-alanyl-D-alanine ligase